MFKNAHSVEEDDTLHQPGQTNLHICMEVQGYLCMYVNIWVSACGDSQNCIDSLSFPAHVGGYPKVGSDQITLACADSVCFCLYISYIHAFKLMCLIACAQSSSFSQPVVCCLLHHTSWERTQKYLIWWSFEINHVCVSMCISLAILLQYFVQAPITMALCLVLMSSQQRNPTPRHWVFISHVYFHRRAASSPPSFHLLPSFIVCSVELQRWVRWDGDQDIKNACMCVCIHTVCV